MCSNVVLQYVSILFCTDKSCHNVRFCVSHFHRPDLSYPTDRIKSAGGINIFESKVNRVVLTVGL